ncbi:hypothetical protein QVD17_08044 [Tagetes erecta]|uniref:Uncharacterized protein n=1 Tax=Tagetes erecta TaxID=13708 RepID=A0AAD8P439_TARER|nr:hypothetical protein QVD17_08044 [Tagetes erecta]
MQFIKLGRGVYFKVTIRSTKAVVVPSASSCNIKESSSRVPNIRVLPQDQDYQLLDVIHQAMLLLCEGFVYHKALVRY